MRLDLVAWAALALVALGVGALAFALVVARAPAASRLGKRGMRRQALSVEHPFIASVEPLLRLVAGALRRLPLGAARSNLEQKLIRAGEPFGFGPEETIAGSLLLGAVGATATYAWATTRGWPAWLAAAGGAFGFALPLIRVGEIARERMTEVTRALPDAMDLFAMCMAAGLDFTGTLRRYLELGVRKKDALREELWMVGHDIDLGHTRRQALEAFAQRMPAPLVRELVSSIVQGEEKGTPLSEVLRVQASMLRMRRSILAEEMVRQAAVKVSLPIAMLSLSSIGILLGTVIMIFKQMGL
jgi:tight adherence protein C